jgi:hypothetical protein
LHTVHILPAAEARGEGAASRQHHVGCVTLPRLIHHSAGAAHAEAITARPAGPSMSRARNQNLRTDPAAALSVDSPAGRPYEGARWLKCETRRRRSSPARASWWPYGTTITTSMHAVVAASRLHPERAHHMGRHELLLLVVTRSERPLPRDKWWSVLPSEGSHSGDPIGRSHGVAAEGQCSPCISLDLTRHPVCARVPLVCASSWSALRS